MTYNKSKPYHQRLSRSAEHRGLPATAYTTEKAVGYCHVCLAEAGLPPTDSIAIPLLTSLGEEVADCDCGQAAVDFSAPSAMAAPAYDETPNLEELLNELH